MAAASAAASAASAPAASCTRTRGTQSAAGTRAARAAIRSRAAWSMRSSPSRWRQSNRAQRQRARAPSTGRATGRDLERERSLIGVEGDRLAVEHGVAHRQRACDLDDLGHARGDVVEAPLKIATSPSRTCTCTRTPSSFHSAPAVPRRSIAVAASGALRRASARADARPRCGTPRAQAFHRRAPPRRPSGGRLPAGARGVRPPAGPPRPSQPRRSARRRARPGAGRPSGGRAGIAARRPSHARRAQPARRLRSPLEPGPDSASSCARRASTSTSVSVGSLAGGGGSPSPR